MRTNTLYQQERRRADRIAEYWSAKGYAVVTAIRTDSQGNYTLKSDTINGLPRAMAGDPSIVRQIAQGRYNV